MKVAVIQVVWLSGFEARRCGVLHVAPALTGRMTLDQPVSPSTLGFSSSPGTPPPQPEYQSTTTILKHTLLQKKETNLRHSKSQSCYTSCFALELIGMVTTGEVTSLQRSSVATEIWRCLLA